MYHFMQDTNLEMIKSDYTDEMDALRLPWEETTIEVEKRMKRLEKKGKISIIRFNRVDSAIVTKVKPEYRDLVEPFFADYLENRVERQNALYDEVINTVRKLLKAHMEDCLSTKKLKEVDGKYWLTSIDIKKHPLVWRRFEYSLSLRVYEFTVSEGGDDSSGSSEDSSSDSSSGSSDGNREIVVEDLEDRVIEVSEVVEEDL
jgi:hypothetical protein